MAWRAGIAFMIPTHWPQKREISFYRAPFQLQLDIGITKNIFGGKGKRRALSPALHEPRSQGVAVADGRGGKTHGTVDPEWA
jgi:hypothetical protein